MPEHSYFLALSSASGPFQYLTTYSCSPVLRLNLVTPSFAPTKITSEESTPSIFAVTPIGCLVSMILTESGPFARSMMNIFLLLMSYTTMRPRDGRHERLSDHITKLMTLLGVVRTFAQTALGRIIRLDMFGFVI